MKRLPARAKIIAVLLETLMAILHSLNQRKESSGYTYTPFPPLSPQVFYLPLFNSVAKQND